MVEQRTHKPLVAGSIPASGTTFRPVPGVKKSPPTNAGGLFLRETRGTAQTSSVSPGFGIFGKKPGPGLNSFGVISSFEPSISHFQETSRPV